MCKDCNTTPNCPECKATAKMFEKTLKRLINKNPKALDGLTNKNMAALTPDERIKELREIWHSGGRGKRKLKQIMVEAAGLQPKSGVSHGSPIVGMRSAIQSKSIEVMGSVGGTIEPSLDLNVIQQAVDAANQEVSSQDATDTGRDTADKVTSIIDASANFLDSAGGFLSNFFGRPASQQSALIVEQPEDTAKKNKTTNIILGVLIAGLVIASVIYFIRKK